MGENPALCHVQQGLSLHQDLELQMSLPFSGSRLPCHHWQSGEAQPLSPPSPETQPHRHALPSGQDQSRGKQSTQAIPPLRREAARTPTRTPAPSAQIYLSS